MIATATRSKTTPRRAAVRPVVLVVDDVPDNRQMYAEYLEYAGYRVAEATTGAEAVELAQTLKPALIIMDLSMPGMDGWRATWQLKQADATKAIPIVVLTGHALSNAQQRAMDAGADAFLTKPCLPDALAQMIANMLGPRGRG